MAISEAQMNGSIRALLNDTAANIYSNAVLLPYFQQTYGKLSEFIVLSGLPHLRDIVSTTMTAGGRKDITQATAGFEEMIEPIEVWERLNGSNDRYILVPRCDDNVQFQNDLEVTPYPQNHPYSWRWQNGQLTISPANSIRELRILIYHNITPSPYSLTAGYSLTVLTEYREYLAHRTAALACSMIAQNTSRAAVLEEEAVKIGDDIKARMVKREQQVPARRRGFWSSRKRRGIVTGG